MQAPVVLTDDFATLSASFLLLYFLVLSVWRWRRTPLVLRFFFSHRPCRIRDLNLVCCLGLVFLNKATREGTLCLSFDPLERAFRVSVLFLESATPFTVPPAFVPYVFSSEIDLLLSVGVSRAGFRSAVFVSPSDRTALLFKISSTLFPLGYPNAFLALLR